MKGVKGALRQFTLSNGKSAGRNSSGRITTFHRGGGSKQLYRRIDLKRSTSSMGIVERIEYDPNRSSSIALVRWIEGVGQTKSNTIEHFAPPRDILEQPVTSTVRGLFSFASLPGMADQRKVTSFSSGPTADYVVVGAPNGMSTSSKSALYGTGAESKKTSAKEFFLSAYNKGETVSSSFGSFSGFPRVAVAGAKPAFFAERIIDEAKGENTFSLSDVRKWRRDSSLWAHRMKRKAAVSWHSTHDTLRFVADAEDNESKPKTDAKATGERPKDRAPVSYIIASHKLDKGKLVMNCDWSKPSTGRLFRPAQYV